MRRLEDAFRFPIPFQERHADVMGPGGDRHADDQSPVRRVHVLLPLRIALRVAGEAFGSGPPLPLAANRESLQQCAIEADVYLVRFSHTHQIEIELTLQDDLDAVVAVERELIGDVDAAAR